MAALIVKNTLNGLYKLRGRVDPIQLPINQGGVEEKNVDFIREYNYSFFLSPHPNIIDTYEGAYQTDDESAFFFVQEICPCSSLREAVETSQNGTDVFTIKKE
uniref:Uncharacterized protein n=1 Tax=Parascaris equorum TaxID=6256 RepID=A0A914R8V4_PAREQ